MLIANVSSFARSLCHTNLCRSDRGNADVSGRRSKITSVERRGAVRQLSETRSAKVLTMRKLSRRRAERSMAGSSVTGDAPVVDPVTQIRCRRWNGVGQIRHSEPAIHIDHHSV